MYTVAIALIKSWVPFRKPFFQWSNWHFAKCELAIFLDQAWGDLKWMRLKNCALGAGAWDDVKKFLQLVYSEKATKFVKNHNFIWNNICNIKMNLVIFQIFGGLLRIYEHHWQKIHFFKAKLHKGFTCYMPNPSRKFFMQFYYKNGFQCWKFQGQHCYSKNKAFLEIMVISRFWKLNYWL